MTNLEQFFSTARERYEIRLRRQAGPPPWTKDRIFQLWRFCQVHREDDRTTQWLNRYVRLPLADEPQKLVESTAIFRWFNRIETGEKILDLLLGEWDTEEARRRLKDVSPVVTGAYIIKGPDYMTKLDGVLFCIDGALPKLRQMAPTWGLSLKKAWEDLCTVYYLGQFMSYEIVSDLRWTRVLCNANDIDTWANAGPGCARGLGWVLNGDPSTFNPQSRSEQLQMLDIMKSLLEGSRNPLLWPAGWRKWEMREVEHWNCEFDKYKRAENGQRLKRSFNAALCGR